MSKDLAVVNSNFIIPSVSEDLMASMNEELNGLTLTLDKVKIPSGGTTSFEVPSDDPDSPDMVKEIAGVIVDHYPLNSYWMEKYTGQNIAPNCYSTDNKVGLGTPGGSCGKCSYNQYGSADDGVSKLCKNSHRLYILQSGELYPIVITVPPTSLKPLSDYLAKRIVTKGLKSYGVVTKLTLKKEANSTGIAYSQLQFSLVEKLPEEQVQAMASFSKNIKGITRRDDVLDDQVDVAPIVDPETGDQQYAGPVVDPETGEVLEPLA